MRKAIDTPEKLPALLPGATILWWEVSQFTYSIRPIQVASETPKTLKVVSMWRDVARTVTMHKNRGTFATWKEARKFALAKATQAAESHRIMLADELQSIEKIKALKEPTP